MSERKKVSRRDFLRAGAVAAVALALSACSKKSPTTILEESTFPTDQPQSLKSFKETGIALENVPTPPSENMNKMRAELEELIPGSNPNLHYIRAGKYISEKDRNQLDSHFVVFDTGESVEDAKNTLKILQRAFTYTIKTNANADITDSIMSTEQIRRSRDEILSQDYTMEIPNRQKEDYVRLGIYGRFSVNETPKFYVLRIWNENQQVRTLDKFYYGNFTQDLTQITDSPNSIATIDSSSRMLRS